MTCLPPCRGLLPVTALLAVFLTAPEAAGQAAKKAPQRTAVPPAISTAKPAPTAGLADLALSLEPPRTFEHIQEKIRGQQWEEAARLLQAVLDRPTASLVPAGAAPPEGRPAVHFVSTSAEAERLLASLPAAGQAAYQRLYGPKAHTALAQALVQGGLPALVRVAQRYPLTPAGQQARDLVRQLESRRRATPPLSPTDWPLVGGTPARSAQQAGAAALLHPLWRAPLFYCGQHTTAAESPTWVAKARHNLPPHCWPASLPLVVGRRILTRSYAGIQACDAATGQIVWHSPAPNSLVHLVDKNIAGKRVWAREWFDFYERNQNSQVLFENAALGQLSSDGRRVYAVTDLALPPPPTTWPNLAPHGTDRTDFGPLTTAVRQSGLEAIDLETGRLIWDLDQVRPDDWRNHFILGAPLPWNGRLYLLTEKDKALHLACLDAETGQRLWRTRLVTVKESATHDVGRRIAGAQLAYADGVLVCPTQAGVLVGFDPLLRRSRWVFAYRQATTGPVAASPTVQYSRPGGTMPSRLQLSTADWKPLPPVIAGDRVVFTAPDAGPIFCVGLHDGALRWQAERADDLYLAGVHDGRVLLVGRTACRALSLVDGKQLWRVQVGNPSGFGALAGNVYYLPLQAGSRSRRPEIVALDLERGAVLAAEPTRAGETPGNLHFLPDTLLSLTFTDLVAYPLLQSRRQAAETAVRQNPGDAQARWRLGQVRRAQGELLEATADLRAALAGDLPSAARGEVQEELFATLTQLLERDFAAGERFLEEYHRLCQVAVPETAPAAERQRLAREQQRRLELYFSLLGRGREQQGRLLDALQAYLDYSALADRTDLVAAPGEVGRRLRPDLWVRDRLARLWAQAVPAQRQLLDEALAARWQRVRDGQLDDLRRFAAHFGPETAAGRAAHLELARRLAASTPLEAALLLLRLLREADDPPTRGRAVEALARLLAARGLVEDAGHFVRLLQRDFATVVIRDGKTGAEMVAELTADPRLAACRSQTTFPPGQIQVQELPGIPLQEAWVPLAPQGELLPFYRQCRLAVLPGLPTGFQLAAFDRGTGRLRWALTVPTQHALSGRLLGTRLPVQVHGHLLVAAVGNVLYAFDLLDRKKLWERPLTAQPVPQGNPLDARYASLMAHYQDPQLVDMLLTRDRYTVPSPVVPPAPTSISPAGLLTPAALCLPTPSGLLGLDPLSGRPLWERTDLPGAFELSADDRYLCAVQGPSTRPTAGHLLEWRDGRPVPAPDFLEQWPGRAYSAGRRLLVKETDNGTACALRLYDLVNGTANWHQLLPPGSRLMKTPPDLLGVVQPDGTARVFDLVQRRQVLSVKLEGGALPQAAAWALQRDGSGYYIFPLAPSAPAAPADSGPTNVSGLATITVAGPIHAVDRTGKLRWRSGGGPRSEELILDLFAELPTLLLTARLDRFSPPAPPAAGKSLPSPSRPGALPPTVPATTVTVTRLIEKTTGRILYEKEVAGAAPAPYFDLRIDRGAGTIDLVSSARVLRLKVGAGFQPLAW